MEDGPIYCSACGAVYYGAALASPRKTLETARIDWRRDWDAIAVGAVVGFLVNILTDWLMK